MARGKSGNPDYVHLGARIPRRLKAQFKSKIALLELDSSEAVEMLISKFVEGETLLEPKVKQHAAPPSPAKRQSTRGGSQPRPPAGDTELGRLRSQLGMSQRVFADALGISQSAVGNYERGKVATPDDVLERARALTTGEDAL
jgi:DNA-binding transcriptional regulator YiaG